MQFDLTPLTPPALSKEQQAREDELELGYKELGSDMAGWRDGIARARLRLQVFDKDFGEGDDFIGGADVDVTDLIRAATGENTTITQPLKNIAGYSAGDLVFSVRCSGGTLHVVALSCVDMSDPDAVTKVAEAGGGIKLLFMAFFFLVMYFVVGCAFYQNYEDFTFVESIYFCVVTFTTVGYGSPVPTTDAGKIFTIGFALLGIGVISVSIAIIAGFAMSKAAAKDAKDAESISGTDVVEEDPMAVALKEETKQIVGGLAQFVVVIALGAGVFCQLEGVSAVDGLYWAAITASTVGYGDVLAKTDEGMIFSCFFILVGCTIMANVISLPTDIYMGRQQRKKMEMVLNAKLDRALFEEMDADGSGDISKDEFLLYMLENLGLVEMGQLRRLESRFNELEESGVLDSYLASKQAEAAEADTEVGAGEDETKDVGAAALQEAAGEESEVAVSPLMAGLAAENGPAQQASVPPPAESPGSAKIKLAPIAGRRKVRIAPEPEAEQDEGGAANDEAT
mmetsp:Transcript_73599/g.209590  ORF Transcript_73599/g.209590 Transcript_73599/m.209590 type:complete len:511 (-) Transcript_73599:212-1744(-)